MCTVVKDVQGGKRLDRKGNYNSKHFSSETKKRILCVNFTIEMPFSGNFVIKNRMETLLKEGGTYFVFPVLVTFIVLVIVILQRLSRSFGQN